MCDIVQVRRTQAVNSRTAELRRRLVDADRSGAGGAAPAAAGRPARQPTGHGPAEPAKRVAHRGFKTRADRQASPGSARQRGHGCRSTSSASDGTVVSIGWCHRGPGELLVAVLGGVTVPGSREGRQVSHPGHGPGCIALGCGRRYGSSLSPACRGTAASPAASAWRGHSTGRCGSLAGFWLLDGVGTAHLLPISSASSRRVSSYGSHHRAHLSPARFPPVTGDGGTAPPPSSRRPDRARRPAALIGKNTPR